MADMYAAPIPQRVVDPEVEEAPALH